MKFRIATLMFALMPVLVEAQAVPEIQFDSVPDPVKLPNGMNLGEVSGVAVNSKGHVFVFSRGNITGPAFGAAAAQLLEFGANGKFIREIGKNLYGFATAHTVKIDPWDNIWTTDKGSDVVVRFNQQGHVTQVLGKRKETVEANARPVPPAVANPIVGEFHQVTDIAWLPDGTAFVSDGYVNSRVVKFNADGEWLGSWGSAGSGPGQFNTPHSIATDAAGLVYVGDRGNRRIQVFDANGVFQRQFSIEVPVPAKSPMAGELPDAERPAAGERRQPALFQAGSPWAICITPSIAVNGSASAQSLFVSDAVPGRIYKLSLDGKVLGVLGTGGKALKKFGWIHQLACPSERELYVAELTNWRIQKLILRPVP